MARSRPALGADAHRLVEAQRRDYLNMAEDGRIRRARRPMRSRLLLKRDIRGFGTETVGTDAGQGMHYDAALSGALPAARGREIRAAVPLQSRPAAPTGAMLIAPPLKIKGGTGSPLRVLALVPSGGTEKRMTEYTAVITGASKGIGADLAARCLSAATGDQPVAQRPGLGA
jgi:hypothetical protein